jgi:NAD(P)-dependent dehydrogenase (short-subunit alcohol dehydrogenase family)
MQETTLITGCSSGIGRATAEAFLDAGWTVYATARDADDVAGLAEQGAETAELDVTDGADCADAVERVVDEQGGLGCLVNNAGRGQLGAVEDVPPRKLHDQFDVNLYGPHRLVRSALPHMRAAGAGRIVNVSSVFGRVAAPGLGAYCASKSALEALSDALRAEVADHGVDVVVVQPALVTTGFDERSVASIPDSGSGAYGDIYEAIEDGSAVGDAVAVPPETVAEAVVEAATCSDPEPRYPVGRFARLALLSRYLPDRLVDAGYRAVRAVVR